MIKSNKSVGVSSHGGKRAPAREIISSGRTQYNDEPLVSVMAFVRNAEKQIGRCVESVLNQTYKNIEFVIQDGASTDKTVEIIKSYKDARIKLVSEPDLGPSDAFWRVLNRCQGVIIGSCLSDEEMTSGAVETAVRTFQAMPHAGAITGDAFIIDGNGVEIGEHTSAPFNIVDYLMADYCPYWSSSFFSSHALNTMGLFENRWNDKSVEFEIWCRLGMDYEVVYVPEKLSKYGIHEGQLSHNWDRVEEELSARIDIVKHHLFGQDTLFAGADYFRDVCVLRQYLNLYRHFYAIKHFDKAAKMHELIQDSGLMGEFESWSASVGLIIPRVLMPIEKQLEMTQIVPAQTTVPSLPVPMPSPFQALPSYPGVFGIVVRIYRVLFPTSVRAKFTPFMKRTFFPGKFQGGEY